MPDTGWSEHSYGYGFDHNPIREDLIGYDVHARERIEALEARLAGAQNNRRCPACAHCADGTCPGLREQGGHDA